ncbi:glycosyltransferase family 2 protein [Aeromicrobium tamlense]|uniref:CDP-glycerol glycerophosphotransferase n=1 Tax=Aeromicrobium tamlense TaxID=375541 RepID=A0A8I0FTK9_9ACTN|nr:glycosyltransferase family A protein [Aeromicrobium tamlense]MBD1270135.1 glycosyltransferase family 2 protein [Aeromicrobium tamlense]NYI39207.1 CDP-glycerol glycerophosphotransferase [Aeromicrobium tamlense]
MRLFRKAAPEPLLSVIVPVYDVEEYLAECLDSILEQPEAPFQVIVVDDGSPDGSAKIARKHARRDARVTVVTRPNGGLSAARMTGIEHATAPYLTFVDSDDRVNAIGLWEGLDSLQRTSADYALLPYQQFRDLGSISPTPPWVAEFYDERTSTVVAHEHPEILAQATAWSKVYRRSFWDRAGLAFREGVLYEDQEVTARAFAAADRIDLVPYPTYLWRVRPGSITREATERSIGAFFDAIALSLDALDTVPGARAARASQVLSNDVPRYLRTLAKVEDEGYRERLFRGALDLLAEPDLDLAEAPAEARVVYALLRAGRASDVATFVEQGGFELASLRSDEVGGEPALVFPFTGDPDVPDEARVLSQRQTPLDATILRAHLDESGLRLTVAAWLRHVDGDAPTCRAWLRDITGWEREFTVAPSAEFIGHRVRTTRRSNEDSVWDLELELPDLDDVDSSELVLEVTHRGRTRREVVTRIDPTGSAAIRQRAGDVALTGEEPWALTIDEVVPWEGDLRDPAAIEIPAEIGEHEVPGLVDQSLALRLPWDVEMEDRQGYLALGGPRRLKVVVQPQVPREQLTFWWQRDHASSSD